LRDDEKEVLLELIARTDQLELDDGWIDSVMVVELDDGGMGSLRFVTGADTTMGRQGGELIFIDDDGVEVLVTLIVDEENNPFEIDVWKTDFSPLVGRLKVG